MSINGATQEKRVTGTRQHVSGTAEVLGNWQTFIENANSKKRLFSFLSTGTTKMQIPDHKDIYITSGKKACFTLFIIRLNYTHIIVSK